jgi:hypothetical protein
VDVEELDRKFTDAIAVLHPRVQRELSRILELPPDDRAREIGHLHRHGRASRLTELLIDLEEDDRTRGLVLAELHNQIRP